ATSSLSESASAPSAASFSRGRSCSGSSWIFSVPMLRNSDAYRSSFFTGAGVGFAGLDVLASGVPASDSLTYRIVTESCDSSLAGLPAGPVSSAEMATLVLSFIVGVNFQVAIVPTDAGWPLGGLRAWALVLLSFFSVATDPYFDTS